jgi:hypothetical protein
LVAVEKAPRSRHRQVDTTEARKQADREHQRVCASRVAGAEETGRAMVSGVDDRLVASHYGISPSSFEK